MSKETEELLAADRAFSRLSQEKGASHAFAQYLVKDAIMLPNNQNPVTGVEAISQAMQTDEKEVLTWEPQTAIVARSGDLGYTWGMYTITLENGKEIKGKYLNIWRKQSDGKWKVAVDMGNSNP